MKKVLVMFALFLLVAPALILAKKPKREWETEWWDIDCDGELDLVKVFTDESCKKKSCTVTKEYYDEYWEYLGEEEWVNDELIMDTFEANDSGYC